MQPRKYPLKKSGWLCNSNDLNGEQEKPYSNKLLGVGVAIKPQYLCCCPQKRLSSTLECDKQKA